MDAARQGALHYLICPSDISKKTFHKILIQVNKARCKKRRRCR
ncbi:hypothetical protein BN137_675 [Cronobacter condimenti 1330]|uniref:Uncharacterized protein n=1 Tax=Cronobacter condimenti 1330 TaxID=1073999 RepID=K7ZY01_9ENTR|nr:hypothetical protein BN137_675 [Cronobacter condimenti 1330]